MELSEETYKVLELLINKLEQDDAKSKDEHGECHNPGAIGVILEILQDGKI